MLDKEGIYIVLDMTTPPFYREYRNEYEDPEHILFVYQKFANERKKLKLLLRRSLRVETTISQMVEYQDVWNEVSCTISFIQKELRRFEGLQKSGSEITIVAVEASR